MPSSQILLVTLFPDWVTICPQIHCLPSGLTRARTGTEAGPGAVEVGIPLPTSWLGAVHVEVEDVAVGAVDQDVTATGAEDRLVVG